MEKIQVTLIISEDPANFERVLQDELIDYARKLGGTIAPPALRGRVIRVKVEKIVDGKEL